MRRVAQGVHCIHDDIKMSIDSMNVPAYVWAVHIVHFEFKARRLVDSAMTSTLPHSHGLVMLRFI